ncbi:phosphate ABC transporter permease PstB [Malacoplasma penetrans HF-2]|uniref:Phosphate import ATP-binding protein PstB n=2 Tax=Malacoplasma penetrans TaxID=28227 RepID=PSTB_MALP2|nr:RecName: Full=Phosphate import ATP-binding protein PstB; AltName: Full=ABC phosphate transporter; AltName: Full=Phosphate-transporting ATPase [Malacoplasma penetrans HF-2]BAC44722.1 phosphate ABC transporter permease PstB [Malacoplasma penetrans HF-2]
MIKDIKNKFSKLMSSVTKTSSDLKTKRNDFKEDFDDSNIFEIRDLNFYYENGKKQALYDVNLDIKKNKVTSFIGPSGCGKSTFLRLLNRMNELLPNTTFDGDIYFEKQNIYSKKFSVLDLRIKVGMVFQKATPFPMSIYDNVAFALKNQGIKNKKILDETIEKSLRSAALWDEVKDNLNDIATDLSGGQQQRLCIARAIACKPSVLLMDEPTSALDPIATSKIEELIMELKEKYTIIIVTHSMAQAQRISDETVFFFQGKIIENGPTKNIFLKPKEKKTRDYINGRIG